MNKKGFIDPIMFFIWLFFLLFCVVIAWLFSMLLPALVATNDDTLSTFMFYAIPFGIIFIAFLVLYYWTRR